jgi:hypothetical protein
VHVDVDQKWSTLNKDGLVRHAATHSRLVDTEHGTILYARGKNATIIARRTARM